MTLDQLIQTLEFNAQRVWEVPTLLDDSRTTLAEVSGHLRSVAAQLRAGLIEELSRALDKNKRLQRSLDEAVCLLNTKVEDVALRYQARDVGRDEAVNKCVMLSEEIRWVEEQRDAIQAQLDSAREESGKFKNHLDRTMTVIETMGQLAAPFRSFSGSIAL